MLNLHYNSTNSILKVPVLTSPNSLSLCLFTSFCFLASLSVMISSVAPSEECVLCAGMDNSSIMVADLAPPEPQSDHSFSSGSESSSDSLYSTAMRRDKMVATSLPTGSFLASCSLCSCTLRSWIPGGGANGSIEADAYTAVQKFGSSKCFTFTFMHLADAFIQMHLGYTFFFCQYMCSLRIEPTTFALLTQCSTTEPKKHVLLFLKTFLLIKAAFI